jgi:hypothetical protein
MASKLAAAVDSSLDELVGIGSSKNNPNHQALTQVIGVLQKWDSKRLNALLMVLGG